MAQLLFITLEWPLDPFLVRESDHKLNFIPLNMYIYLFEAYNFTYDLHVKVHHASCHTLYKLTLTHGKMHDGLSHAVFDVCIHFAF